MPDNLIDRVVSWLSPQAGLRRAQARQVLSYYEAARPSPQRRARREAGSGNTAVARAGSSLREQARHLEQNHDLARGVLDVLVRNTVGPGIGVEPQPRRKNNNNEIHAEFAEQLHRLREDWCRRPEVTWLHDNGGMERIAARALYRDGEVFAQRLTGPATGLSHGTLIPYSVELLEADLVPFTVTDPGDATVVQGVEVNAWGRPIAYRVLYNHPGDMSSINPGQTKRLPAERMLHLALRDRIRQYRGVSVFSSVLARLDDLRDYEESERIAAKIAASMAAYIIKASPDVYEPGDDDGARDLMFQPGMIMDDLRPGESIGTIDTNRPNPNLLAFRQGQLRAVACGTGISYSSASRDYGGTYSSQRQELVEQFGAYQILSLEFISGFTRPVYEDMVSAALLSGLIRLPNDLDLRSLYDAQYVAPQMPWIDPLKEAEALILQLDHLLAGAPEVIRRRGGNPRQVLESTRQWNDMLEKMGLAPPDKSSPPTPDPQQET